MDPQRRRWLGASLAGTALGWLPHARSQDRPRIGRVVVVGAGFGGAAVAKYIRLWEPGIEVTLVERNAQFISCPMSNLVLAGTRTMAELTQPAGQPGPPRRATVRPKPPRSTWTGEEVRLAGVSPLAYDRLRFLRPVWTSQFEKIPGWPADRRGRVLHAWKAGPQPAELRARLEALPNGAVFAICVPRHPSAARQARMSEPAWWRTTSSSTKPRGQVVVLDLTPNRCPRRRCSWTPGRRSIRASSSPSAGRRLVASTGHATWRGFAAAN